MPMKNVEMAQLFSEATPYIQKYHGKTLVIGGGLALAKGGCVQSLPLDIAGLMSSLPAEEVAARTAHISAAARRMGVKEGYDPFMTLAFLALPVIPHLKLTDKGLFDGDKFAFTKVEV